jgi:hypothetical protein
MLKPNCLSETTSARTLERYYNVRRAAVEVEMLEAIVRE